MRKKIVAIQIALFLACVDTRKNSRDSNRAFLVCGNAPINALLAREQVMYIFPRSLAVHEVDSLASGVARIVSVGWHWGGGGGPWVW